MSEKQIRELRIANKDLSQLKNGFNDITGVELHNIIHNAYLSLEPLTESPVIKVGLVIRSTYSNKVFHWGDNNIVSTTPVIEDQRNLEGAFLLLVNVKKILDIKLDKYNPEDIAKSVIQPVGIISEDLSLTLVYMLIVEDKILDTLIPLNTLVDSCSTLGIEDLATFTNVPPYTRMILPTLKIVRSGNSEENKVDREQWL